MATFLASSSPLATLHYTPNMRSINFQCNSIPRTIVRAKPSFFFSSFLIFLFSLSMARERERFTKFAFFHLQGVPCMIGGLRLVPKIKITEAARKSSRLPSCPKTTISCSIVKIWFSVLHHMHAYRWSIYTTIPYIYMLTFIPINISFIWHASGVLPEKKYVLLNAEQIYLVCTHACRLNRKRCKLSKAS